MSTFHKFSVSVTVWIACVVVLFNIISTNSSFINWTCKIIILLSYLIITEIFDELEDICVFKYRIKIIKNGGKTTYLPQAFGLGIFMIPYWKSLSEECDEYETQNLFGAKDIDYDFYDAPLDSIEEAESKIKFKKNYVKCERERFFNRETEKETVTYKKY